MRLKVKTMAIATGGILVAVINQKDAERLDLHPMDRVKLQVGNQSETVVLDISRTDYIVAQGQIGLYKEVTDNLAVHNGQSVDVFLAKKPVSLDFIKKKLDGHILTRAEFDQIIWDIVHNRLNDTELTYFVAACYTNSLTTEEVMSLTKAMTEQGERLVLNRSPVMDKHCVGGLAGNRTTPIIVSIVAAAGLTIPKTSSRSITSPAGTADTMEVLANVNVPLPRMKEIVEKANGCVVWGGALNLAPSDDKIIKVERPLSIDAESQLIASILAKKLSVSSTHILLDIPVGKAAKIKHRHSAEILKKHFELAAKKLRIHVKVIITDGSQPIGNGIGPCLEARDVLLILKNDPKGPADLREKSLMMAGLLLEMGNKAAEGKGYKLAKKILESGAAYKKMKEIIHLQGKHVDEPDKVQISNHLFVVKARKSGRVVSIDNEAVTRISRVAGAPQSQIAGMFLHKHVGDSVRKNEPLFTVYASCSEKLSYAKELTESSEVMVIN
ncbi:MAG: AMP phosphorylase [Candidatus Woesearchaeota archaeon]